MKKKNSKNNNERRQRRSDEDRALNRELGNFGLEPPKIYKPSQRSEGSYSSGDSEFGDLPSFSRRREQDERDRSSRANDSRRRRDAKPEKDKRKISKIKRKVILYCALTLSIAALVIALSLTVLFKIHNINIKGNEVYSQKEIQAILPIEKENNLFLIDKKRAQEKLEENLPYIYNVDIKRKIPSTVEVIITETPQVYCILNGDNTYTYLDGKFKVLEDNGGSRPEGSILIKDVKLKSNVVGQKAVFTDKKAAKNLKSLADTVTKLSLDKITAIYTKDINNNYMEYDSRITFKLGTLDNLEKKVYSALTATQKLDETNPGAKGTMTIKDDKQVYFTAG